MGSYITNVYTCGCSLSVTCQVAMVKGADTLPTQNGLLVAMHMVYLVLLFVELFHYAGELSTL